MSNRALLIGWRTRWNRSLLRFIGRRVRAAVDIEDVAQETYLRLLRTRDLQGISNPQGYLLRVASHVVAEWWHRRPPYEKLEGLNESFLIDERTPEFELDAKLSQAVLDQALENIPALTRTILLLKYRENYQCKRIAQELELTERQVRRHLTRGVESLRGAMLD
jgi:RNA polymerase sigma-70 factor (ECF subfamily)